MAAGSGRVEGVGWGGQGIGGRAGRYICGCVGRVAVHKLVVNVYMYVHVAAYGEENNNIFNVDARVCIHLLFNFPSPADYLLIEVIRLQV